MKSFIFLIFFVIISFQKISATAFYNVKEKVLFIDALKQNVIIWKSVFELNNNNKKSIAIRIPCYLCYTYAYLNPSEISTVQSYVPEYTLSDVYKNFVATKPIMVNAKQTIINICNVLLRSIFNVIIQV